MGNLGQTVRLGGRGSKPPLAMPRMVRGGGIFEENDGGDLLQGSECSEICYIRIPSGATRQHPYPFWPFGPFPPDRGNRPLEPKGSLWIVRIRIGLSLFAAAYRNLSVSFADSSPGRGAFTGLTPSAIRRRVRRRCFLRTEAGASRLSAGRRPPGRRAEAGRASM